MTKPLIFDIEIYTDGACDNNGFSNSYGGWGAVINIGARKNPLFLHGGSKPTTNQRMEMTAAIEALKFVADVPGSVRIYSDSAYLVNCITKKWFARWRRNGWKTLDNTPVKNSELWIELLRLIESRKKMVLFVKVRGHAGNILNEKADELAVKGKHAAGKAPGNSIEMQVSM